MIDLAERDQLHDGHERIMSFKRKAFDTSAVVQYEVAKAIYEKVMERKSFHATLEYDAEAEHMYITFFNTLSDEQMDDNQRLKENTFHQDINQNYHPEG